MDVRAGIGFPQANQSKRHAAVTQIEAANAHSRDRRHRSAVRRELTFGPKPFRSHDDWNQSSYSNRPEPWTRLEHAAYRMSMRFLEELLCRTISDLLHGIVLRIQRR